MPPPGDDWITLDARPHLEIDTNIPTRVWTTNHLTMEDRFDYNIPKFITDKDLKIFEKILAEKLYRIISEHAKIDISEEDFINLLEK